MIQFPSSRHIRSLPCRFGFGIEFWVRAATPGGTWSCQLWHSGSSLLVVDAAPNLRASIWHTAGVVILLYPTGASPFWLDDGQHHHVRFSVRRRAPQVASLSLDGSQPAQIVVPNTARLFDPSYGDFTLILNGTVPTYFDSLRIWDAFHYREYPLPGATPDATGWLSTPDP